MLYCITLFQTLLFYKKRNIVIRTVSINIRGGFRGARAARAPPPLFFQMMCFYIGPQTRRAAPNEK